MQVVGPDAPRPVQTCVQIAVAGNVAVTLGQAAAAEQRADRGRIGLLQPGQKRDRGRAVLHRQPLRQNLVRVEPRVPAQPAVGIPVGEIERMVHILGVHAQVGVKALTALGGRLAKRLLPAVRHRARQKVQTRRIAHQRQFEYVRRALARPVADMTPDRMRRIGRAKVPVEIARRDPHVLRNLIPPLAEHLRLRLGVRGLVRDRGPQQLAVDRGQRIADQAHPGQNAFTYRQPAAALAVVLVRAGRVLTRAPHDRTAHARHVRSQARRETVPLVANDLRERTDVGIDPVLVRLGIVEREPDGHAKTVQKTREPLDRLGARQPALELRALGRVLRKEAETVHAHRQQPPREIQVFGLRLGAQHLIIIEDAFGRQTPDLVRRRLPHPQAAHRKMGAVGHRRDRPARPRAVDTFLHAVQHAAPIAAADAQHGAVLHLDTKVLRLQIAPGVVQPDGGLRLRRMHADSWPRAAQLFDPARQLVRRRPHAWTGIARHPDRFDSCQLHVADSLRWIRLPGHFSTVPALRTSNCEST